MTLPTVLYEDNHLIAIHKPPGMLSQGDVTGDLSAVDWVTEYIREKYNKPGNVYMGLLHRLDRPVAGVLLFAKTSKAAARMSRAFQNRKITKIYHAITVQPPSTPHGRLQHHIRQLKGHNIVRAEQQAGPDSKPATLDYRVLARTSGLACVEVLPTTGRKHQIRVQLSKIDCPIVGDIKYGAPELLPDKSIALLAYGIRFTHPVRKDEQVEILSEVPKSWPWRLFGEVYK